MPQSPSVQWSIADWQRIYDNLTDPDKRAEAARQIAIKRRIEQKKKDTGL